MLSRTSRGAAGCGTGSAKTTSVVSTSTGRPRLFAYSALAESRAIVRAARFIENRPMARPWRVVNGPMV